MEVARLRRNAGTKAQSGGEQWFCPTGLAARTGFQPITALRGFTLRENGGEQRSCAPTGIAGPSVFKAVSAPRRICSPKVPAAGFAPASVRLEGGGLGCSATRRKIWQVRLELHQHYAAFEARPTICCRRTRVSAFARLEPRRDAASDSEAAKSGPPARNCTRNSTFARSHDRSFTTGRKLRHRPESHRRHPRYKGGVLRLNYGGKGSRRWTCTSTTRQSGGGGGIGSVCYCYIRRPKVAATRRSALRFPVGETGELLLFDVAKENWSARQDLHLHGLSPASF